MTIEDFAKSKKKSIKIVRNWIKKGYIPGASIEDNYVPNSARIPYTMARAKTANAIYCSIIKAANACLHVFPELYGIGRDEFDGYIRRLEEAGFIEARISDGITYYDATIKAMHSSREFILAVIEASSKGIAGGVTETCLAQLKGV